MLYILLFVLLTAALAALLWPLRQQWQFCVIVTLFFFIGTFGIYAVVGAPHLVPILTKYEMHMQEVQVSIIENSAAVKANPKNLRAWIKLGGSLMETGKYQDAVNAFKHTVILSKGNPQLILAYAKAMIMADDGKVGNAAKKSLEMALLQEPDNAEAKYFLIVRTLQDGKTEKAMREMKTLYHSLPNDSPVKEMIDRQIGQAD